jgi:hypothetical protein
MINFKMKPSASKFLNEIRPIPYLEFSEPYDFDKRMESFLSISKTLCPDFQIDKDNKEIYENTVKYFAADETGKYNIRKGLYVYGSTGVGKTLYFKIFYELNRALDSKNNFKILNICDLIDGITSEGSKYFASSHITPNKNTLWRQPEHILIDDLGQSEEIASYFGNNINVAVEFIRRRHYAYVDQFTLTHVATNLKPSDIEKKYGKYLKSRMVEMFNVIFFQGKDRRK